MVLVSSHGTEQVFKWKESPTLRAQYKRDRTNGKTMQTLLSTPSFHSSRLFRKMTTAETGKQAPLFAVFQRMVLQLVGHAEMLPKAYCLRGGGRRGVFPTTLDLHCISMHRHCIQGVIALQRLATHLQAVGKRQCYTRHSGHSKPTEM